MANYKRSTFGRGKYTLNIGHSELTKLGKTFKAIESEIQTITTFSAMKAQLELAPKLVYSAAQQRGYNSYTGSLAHSYGASLTVDGQHYANYVMEDGAITSVNPPPNTIKYSKKNHRPYAEIQSPRKNMNTPLYFRRNYKLKKKHKRGRKSGYNLFRTRRFLNKYESVNGYHHKIHWGPSIPNRTSTWVYESSRVASFKAFVKRNGSKKDRKFYIQLYNNAPYAAMVQARGHNVLNEGVIRGRGRYMRQVVVNVTKKEIEKALHNYKKDYARMQTGKADLAFGRKMKIESEDWG